MPGSHGTPGGMRVLVTGAAGFLGSHLCERLTSRGHSVWGLDNFDPSYDPDLKRANLAAAAQHPGLRVVEGDVRDTVLLDGLFGSVPFDLVVHLAAKTPPRPSFQDARPCYDVNVAGTLEVVGAMRRHHVSRLILGSGGVPQGEDALHPGTPLASSLRSAELAAHVFHRLARASVLCLRFADVYGPRQRPDSELVRLWRTAEARRTVVVPAADASWGCRDYVYVDDAVAALELATDRLRDRSPADPLHAEFDVGTGRAVGRDELVATLSEELGRRPRTRGSVGRRSDRETVVADVTRSRELLGFTASTELATGLRSLAAWLAGSESGRLVAQPTS